MRKITQTPRVLLIAEAANPTFVSVPLVGWSLSRAIAAKVSCLVVTQVRNRQAFLDQGLLEGQDFVALDTERIAKPLYRFSQFLRRCGLGWTSTTAVAAISYYAFEHRLVQQLGSRVMAGEFDLVHRITPLSPTVPSGAIARLCQRAGVPLLLGPLNGGVPWPKQFRRAQHLEGEWLAYVRGAYRFLPGYRRTLESASVVLVGSQATQEQIPERWRCKCVYVPENAIDPSKFIRSSSHSSPVPLRIGFVGRLVPYKGADMLLEALAPFVRDGRVIVNIYGDGPEAGRLRDLIACEQMASGATLRGWVPHQELAGLLSQDHMLVFPSIREFGGGVVLEAMALGVVPAVVGYGGPGELVTEDTGFTIPLGSREEIVAGIRRIVDSVLSCPESLDDLRHAGMMRVREHFTWDAKAAKVLEVYRWVRGQRDFSPADEPGFSSMPSAQATVASGSRRFSRSAPE